MIFKNYLYPDRDYDSVYEIDYEEFYKMGYRAIFFDIDNTLINHGAQADLKLKIFFKKLRQTGFRTCLISNNRKERVKDFADGVLSEYIHKSGKPGTKGIKKAVKLLGVEMKDCIFIGDQIFTDVIAGKRAGIYTILVKPINPKEEIQIVIKRIFERIVLYFYERRGEKNV